MKKLLAIALAVLGFTAAQAVNISWTLDATDYNSTSTITNFGCYASCSYSLYAAITIKDGVSNIFDVERRDGNIGMNSTRLKYDSTTKKLVLETKVGSAANSFSHLVDLATGVEVNDTVKLAYSFVRGAAVSGVTTGTFNIWCDGELILKDKVVSGWNGPINGVEAFVAIDELKIANGYVITSAEGEELTVPEPTALALLALGVAGLALKRKHA